MHSPRVMSRRSMNGFIVARKPPQTQVDQIPITSSILVVQSTISHLGRAPVIGWSVSVCYTAGWLHITSPAEIKIQVDNDHIRNVATTVFQNDQ